VECEKNNFVS